MSMPKLAHALAALLTAALLVIPAATPQASFANTPNPTSVTIAGSLNSEMGCSGDWQPDCALAHLAYSATSDVWKASFNLPAGNYEYKAALNDGWAESYGRNGNNVPLSLATDSPVTFYYDHKTNWVTDNKGSVIATAPGDFQSELGCPGDWEPNCLRSWLQDPDGDGTYSFETTALPAGAYNTKVAINENWAENYGQGGVFNGGNISFVVPENSVKVTFRYNATSHVLTVSSGHGNDNNVEYSGLGHDSQSDVYRVPFGAVNPNTAITLRFRTYHNDATGVRARFYDTAAGREFFRDMSIVAANAPCYDPAQPGERCDFWSTTITPTQIGTLYYRFSVTDGSATAFYADDGFKDGGWGAATPGMIDNSYVITVFDPAFQPIPWMQDGVVYQIFPDRFRNGNTANDPTGSEPRYRYPGNADDQIIKKAWGSLPEGYCQKYQNPATPCAEGPRGRDYFGGDLKGVQDKLDYLQGLGVTVIYFNPVFEAASNHLYDTRDYKTIDPFFGTKQDWDNLVAAAEAKGIKIVLDGVFNHVSSDSIYFDRYGHFAQVGACENVNSPYRSWFYFRDVTPGSGPCAGSQGPNSANYDAWFGFDSLPVLNKNVAAVRDLVYGGSDSVAKYWLNEGAAGWRLDVMGDGSFPDDYWQEFRDSVKATSADAPVIGELWKKEEILPKIHGDQADTVMNYRFRNAVMGYLGTVDDKGFPDDGQSDQPPSLFARKIMSTREDYPDATFFTAMNIFDSHDTQRILWSLTPGARNRESKELNSANLALGKQNLKLAAVLQMTMPGAPTIYYGDEVALNGDDDPDDRRTYPWADQGGSPDTNMLAHYSNLTEIRADNPVLSRGDIRFLLTDDTARTLAYGRRTADAVAIVAMNPGAEPKQLTIPTDGYLRDGVAFTDALGNATATTTAGGKIVISLAARSAAVLLANANQDLTAPAAPTTLVANAGNGSVMLGWNGSAASYNVYRSLLMGGGYTKVATVSGTAYNDTSVTNGQRYFYIVRALDAAGNESTPSNEASASPAFPIGYAALQWPPSLTHTLGTAATQPIYGQVYVAGLTDVDGPSSSILAQVGFGAPGSTPASWTTWKAMTFNTKAGNNYEYQATLRPEAVGNYDYLVRFSTNGGQTWTYGDRSGIGTNNPGNMTVNANSDTTAPNAPANLRVTDWNPNNIKLAWDAVNDAAEYWLYRREGSGSNSERLAIIPGGTTTYDDTAVSSGTTYTYFVKAVDAALNVSQSSNEVAQRAEQKVVNVTFRVRVPAETPAADKIYIAGNIDLLGPWNPGKQVMTQTSTPGIWEVTLPILDGTALQYKYTRGSWDMVENWGALAGTANRSITISYGANGTQLIDNTSTASDTDPTGAVLAWRDALVQSVTPATGSTQENPVAISATWSRPVVYTGAGDVLVLRGPGNTRVAGTVAASGDRAFTFTPAAALAPGQYTVTAANVKRSDVGDGAPMMQPYTWSFTVPTPPAPNMIDVTFRVRVPADTPAADTIYITGNTSALGPWNPAKQALANKGGGVWEATLPLPEGLALQYKYTRGTLETAESWGTITGAASRSVTIGNGASATQMVDDTATDWGYGSDDHKAVQAWRDPLIQSVSPAPDAAPIGPITISATWSQPVIASAYMTDVLTVRGPGNSAVAGSVGGSGQTFVFTPTLPLSTGMYTVTAGGVQRSGIADPVPMVKPYTWNFSVGMQLVATPEKGGKLIYKPTEATTITLSLPANAVTETTTLLFAPLGDQSAQGLMFAGHAFSIDAYQNGARLSEFSFQQPLTVEISYSDGDVAGMFEDSLRLYYREGQRWVDAATSCTPPSVYQRAPQANRLSVNVCHLTEFALFGQVKHERFVPIVAR